MNWCAPDVVQRLALPVVVTFAISHSVHNVDLAGITVAMPLFMLLLIAGSRYVAPNLLAPLMNMTVVLLALDARRLKSGGLELIRDV